MWLWETWLTPNLVCPPNMQYYNCGQPDIRSYLHDLTINTAMLGIPYSITNELVVRVGGMFSKVASSGFADINPYDNQTARINLWAGDNINASKYSRFAHVYFYTRGTCLHLCASFHSYLAALTLARRLGRFPVMSVPRAAGSAATELGISEDIAAKLAQFVDNTEVPT